MNEGMRIGRRAGGKACNWQANKQTRKWVDMKDKVALYQLVGRCMHMGVCVCVWLAVRYWHPQLLLQLHTSVIQTTAKQQQHNKSIWILAAFVFRFIAACYTRVLGVYVTFRANVLMYRLYVCVGGTILHLQMALLQKECVSAFFHNLLAAAECRSHYLRHTPRIWAISCISIAVHVPRYVTGHACATMRRIQLRIMNVAMWLIGTAAYW